MKENNSFIRYSSLRNAESKADADVYGNLARKTLLLIDQLAGGNQSTTVPVLALKNKLSINTSALIKILDILITNSNIELKLIASTDVESNAKPDISQLHLRLTGEGAKAVKAAIYAIEGIEN